MPLRFRRSKQILPGVKVNLNKNSASVTVGGKHFRQTYSTNGKTTTSASLPGTGLFYTHTEGRSGHRSEIRSMPDDAFFRYAEDFTRETSARLEEIGSDHSQMHQAEYDYYMNGLSAIQAESRRRTRAAKVLRVLCTVLFGLFAVAFLLSFICIFRVGLSDSGTSGQVLIFTIGSLFSGIACLVLSGFVF